MALKLWKIKTSFCDYLVKGCHLLATLDSCMIYEIFSAMIEPYRQHKKWRLISWFMFMQGHCLRHWVLPSVLQERSFILREKHYTFTFIQKTVKPPNRIPGKVCFTWNDMLIYPEGSFLFCLCVATNISYWMELSLLAVVYSGLQNQGATCYLNSALQILFMTKEFREAVER